MPNTILITGASSGIGRTTARFFQAKGWNVIATMRKPESEQELNQLDNVLVSRIDVQDQASMQDSLTSGIERFGQIDVLLNNAGYGAYGVLEATPIEKVKRQFDVNVIGLIAMTKAVLPHFRQNRKGTIINIASIGGKMSFPLGTLYHGSKFAVEGLSESLHFELEPLGIKTKIIEPGVINTNFSGSSLDFSNDESLSEYQPFVSKLLKGMKALGAGGSDPLLVSEVIYQAATDGSDQLRYPAGEDAFQIIAHRKQADDATFIGGIKKQFDLQHVS